MGQTLYLEEHKIREALREEKKKERAELRDKMCEEKRKEREELQDKKREGKTKEREQKKAKGKGKGTAKQARTDGQLDCAPATDTLTCAPATDTLTPESPHQVNDTTSSPTGSANSTLVDETQGVTAEHILQ